MRVVFPRMLVAVVAGLGLSVVAASPAAAQVCSVTIDGRDLGSYDSPGRALHIDPDRKVVVAAVITPGPGETSAATFTVALEIAGFRIDVADGQVQSFAWAAPVPIGRVADVATGVYKVVTRTEFASGSGCRDTAYVVVDGAGVLGTVAGKVALVLVVIGIAGVVAALVTKLLLLIAMPAGAVGGLGVLLLLQQAGSVYPTRAVSIAAVVLGLAAPPVARLALRR